MRLTVIAYKDLVTLLGTSRLEHPWGCPTWSVRALHLIVEAYIEVILALSDEAHKLKSRSRFDGRPTEWEANHRDQHPGTNSVYDVLNNVGIKKSYTKHWIPIGTLQPT